MVDHQEKMLDIEKQEAVEPRSEEDLAIALHLDDSSEEEQTADLEAVQSKHSVSNNLNRVVTAQDWIGPDDPENPHNWPLSKRIFHVVQPALFGLAVTFGSSVYSSGIDQIMEEFHVSSTAAFVGVSVYVFGLGFGPVLGAPISETFGRLVVYRSSLPISMLFTLGAGFTHSFAGLIICRLFAGLFGSAVLAVGAGTNADCFPAKSRAYATIWFLLAPFLGTALGPLIGGFAAQYKGWRWTMWCQLFMGVLTYAVSLTMKETYKKTILQQRAKRLGIEPPKVAGPKGAAKIKFLLTVTLFRPVHMLIFEPIVLFMSLYAAFLFGVLFAFLPAFPIVFGGIYHFSIAQTGLAFISLAIGYMLAVPTAMACDRWLYQSKHTAADKHGKPAAPEHRLYSAMIGSFGVSIGLFWFAWTAREDIHWIVPMLGAIPFSWGNLCVFVSYHLEKLD
jgi:MFS family permease